MTDMTREYELIEGLYCEFDFEFCNDNTMDSAAITSIKLPNGTWLTLPAPIFVHTDRLAAFAEREKAERDADWAAENRLDRRRSWEDGL
jgi:hypothetical protein